MSFHFSYKSLGDRAKSLIEKNSEGYVFGVFSSSLYCLFGNQLLLFHSAEYGSIPFGVGLGDIRAFLGAANAEPDAPVILGENIKIGGFEFSLSPESENLSMFDSVREKIAVRAKIRPEKLSRMAAYVCARGSENGLLPLLRAERDTDGIYSSHARAGAKTLMLGMRENDNEKIREGVKSLVGLGRGLTPSGDDFLSGFVTIFNRAAAAGRKIPPCVDALKLAVREFAYSTSIISGMYLECAAAGEYFELVDSFADYALGFCTRDGDALICAPDIFKIGASSGTDTAVGMLYAMQLL